MGVNYSTAKSIFFTYRKEGRIRKKAVKTRLIKKKSHTASELSQWQQHLSQNRLFYNPWNLFGNADPLLQTFPRPLIDMLGASQSNRMDNTQGNQSDTPGKIY